MQILEHSITVNDSDYTILALLDYEADSRDALLRDLSRCALSKGKVKPSFEEALLQREKEYPTGLPLEHTSVAIPHTRPEHVLYPGMVAVRLKKPVTFVQMASENVPVDVQFVFLLLIRDSEKQIFMLQSLMSMCQSRDSVDALNRARNAEEIADILAPYIKRAMEVEESL